MRRLRPARGQLELRFESRCYVNAGPTLGEVWTTARMFRESEPLVQGADRRVNSGEAWCLSVLTIHTHALGEWSRRWQQPFTRHKSYLTMLGNAMLAQQWLFDGGDPSDLISVEDCCSALNVGVDTMRDSIRRELDQAAFLWLAALRGVFDCFPDKVQKSQNESCPRVR